MLSEQQQRIMGYFIEEAKDHLNTIEQGLLNLKATIEDPEMVHEVFRAAHSVKGGAAMLGLTSIQHTAHRLEDYFKVLKECPVKIDQKLETLLLRVYDTLDDLLEQLQGPFGLTDDKAEEAMAGVEPVFVELNQHLSQLVNQSGAQPPEDVNLAGTTSVQEPPAVNAQLSQVTTEESALRFIFQNDVPARLREMLQLFKQADTPESRQELQALCQALVQPGEQLDIPAWCELLAIAEQAIANSDNTYRTLAPVIIKDIKRAQEQVLAGNLTNIAASEDLLALVPQALPSESDLSDAAFADLFGSGDAVAASEDLFAADSPAEAAGLFDDIDTGFDGIDTELAETGDLFELDDGLDESMSSLANNQTGPEVGMAELNTLADLFEGEDSELGFAWQEEIVDSADQPTEALDQSADFSDLLFQGGEELALDSTDEDLSGLLNNSAQSVSSEASLDSLFDFGVDSGEAVPSAEDSQALDQLFAGLDLTSEGTSETASIDFQADSNAPLFGLDSIELDEAAELPQELTANREAPDVPFDLEPEELPDFTLELPESDMPSELAELESDPGSAAASFDLSGLGLDAEPKSPADPTHWQIADPWGEESELSELSGLSLDPDLAVSNQDFLVDPFANLNPDENPAENFAESELFTLDSEPDQQDASTADFSLDLAEARESAQSDAELLADELDLSSLAIDADSPELNFEQPLDFDAPVDFSIAAADNTANSELLQFSPETNTHEDEAGFDLNPISSAGSDLNFINSAPEGFNLSFDAESAEATGSSDATTSDATIDQFDIALFGEAEIPPNSELTFGDGAEGDSPTAETASTAEELPTDLDDLFAADLAEASESVEAVNLSNFELPEDFAETDNPLTSEVASDLDDLLLASDTEASESAIELNTELDNSLEGPFGLNQAPAAEAENPFAESELEFGLFEEDADPTSEVSLEAAPAGFDFDAMPSEDQVGDDPVEANLAEADVETAESEETNFDLELGSESEAAAVLPDLEEFNNPNEAGPELESLFESDLQLGMESDFGPDLELGLIADNQSEDSLAELDQLNQLAPESLNLNLDESLNASTIDDSDTLLDWDESNLSLDSDNLFAATNQPDPADSFDFGLESGTEAEQGEVLDFLSEESDSAAVELDLDRLEQPDISDISVDLAADSQFSELSLEGIDKADVDMGLNLADLNESPQQERIELNQDFGQETLDFGLSDPTEAEDSTMPDLLFNDAELETELLDLESVFDSALHRPEDSAAPDASAFAETTDLFSDTSLRPEADSADSSDMFAFLDVPEDASSLLADEGTAEFGNISVEPTGLDDLEAILAEDSPSVTAIHDEQAEVDVSTNFESLENESPENTADFADLEALLEDGPAIAPEVTPEIAPEIAPEVTPEPMTLTEMPATSSVDDEFGDLEALLQDADQTLGVGSSPVRKANTVSNRRPNRRSGLSDQTMRVSVKHLDNLNNLVGEMVVNRNSLEQAEERLRQFLDNLLYQVQQLSDVGQRMRDLYERSLLESSLLSSRRGQSGTTPVSGFGSGQSNHATGLSFDALEMDRFTGFHTLSQEMIELIVRVRESASDIDFVVEETDQVTRNFRQITTQLQEGLTRSRMVPFAQTADRLPRGVRDNSLRYGKQAELIIEGRDTLIDKMIVEQLYDPMTHLVNNAIAHGIETPEERIAAGKPPTGRITIRAFHQGNQTVISVSDDGAGINPEKVRAKALAKGLITPAQAREMSRLDTYDLLFHHGFSTVEQVDDLRGRGVGLDVVRSNLNEIRGTISIDSTVGKGTTFTIRLPLTLSISKALCCISNRARIAFPMDGVEDMLDVPQERIQIDDQGRQCIQWRDNLLPFQPLSELLRYNRVLGRGSVYGGNQEEDIISIVVLRSAGNFLALQVDQVLGEQEIVIKQLEGPIPKPLGVAGATVLGDGRIMPIADVLELIDLWQGRIRREAGSSLWDQGEAQLPSESVTKSEPTVLIVDDSITVRELLSMTFSKVGYRVEQARDGQEAWEKLRSGLPCDLVFCDIEMPRMDGLELLSRIQKDPNLNHLPIAMLTSRGADRHRQMAVQLGAKGYFTKPYLEEVLLDAAQRMLKGEVLVSSTNIQ